MHSPDKSDSQPQQNASPASPQDLRQTVLEFADIQAELNYRQAQDVLSQLVNRLDLTAQERRGLEAEIQGLQTMLDKLNHAVVHIAVFGMVGRGKSSILNALVGQNVFTVGPTHGVTRDVSSTRWSLRQEAVAGSDRPLVRFALRGSDQSHVELIDTPGIDEVAGEERERLATEVAQQADLILFVVAGDITQVEYNALCHLREASKPMILVFNKIDQYPAADRTAIYHKIRDDRVRELLSPDEIVMAAAAPLVASAVRHADGKVSAQLSRGTPQVDDLKLKILDILDREGKSLVALNTMLYADNINEQVVQRKALIRDRSANQVIWNATITKAVAIALNPLTVLDLLSGAVIDVAMILTLSRLYGIDMTQQGAVALLQKIAIGMGGIGASELLATLGLSSLKSLLGLSTAATSGATLAPYLSVAITQAGVAGVATYGIGQVAKAYLLNGASWGADGPKAVVTRILESLDEETILVRIKDELRQKLQSVGRKSKADDLGDF